MSAQILDGAAVARSVRERVAEGVRELIAAGGPQPGLATVLVGADPASQIYVRRKNEQTAEAGMRSFHHELPASTPQAELDALDRRAQRRCGGARHPGAEPLAGRPGRGALVRPHRPRQGRRRISPRERRPARAQPPRPALVHAGGRDRAARSLRDRPGGPRARGRGPLQHRRQAGCSARAASQRDGHDRPLAHARPALGDAPRRGADRGHRPRRAS